jgi:c-di-GMP-binding flagellar brake protein YcgR
MSSQPGRALKSTAERRRRRYPRYRSEFPVTIKLLSGGEHQLLAAHCKDLSQAGIGALVAAELPMGEVVSLSFALPEAPQRWEVRAVLRHRRGYHYGFEFLSFSQDENRTLESYLVGLQRADSD